ncbi:MAG: hypothetical protein PVH29_11940 [Candidatus Zixiibacteriota bacterium]
MNKNVHYWMVCDAVRYIKYYGSARQREALENFQEGFQAHAALYFDEYYRLLLGTRKVPAGRLPMYETLVEIVVGTWARWTDCFQDVAVRPTTWVALDNITEWDGHSLTALNHFIIPFETSPRGWRRGCGYWFPASSRDGKDAWAVARVANLLRLGVAIEQSSVLQALKPLWDGADDAWDDNFEVPGAKTVFAPVSTLAWYYYRAFLRGEALDVRIGPADFVAAGPALLGPCAHAFGDACVPQHVRGTLDLYHQEWEAWVETLVYHWDVDLVPPRVEEFLEDEPFVGRWEYGAAAGEHVAGTMAIDYVVYEVARLAVGRLARSFDGPDGFYKSGRKEWAAYMEGPYERRREDAEYLYNLAVAGTVHLIERAWDDVGVAASSACAGGETAVPAALDVSLAETGRMDLLPAEQLHESFQFDAPPGGEATEEVVRTAGAPSSPSAGLSKPILGYYNFRLPSVDECRDTRLFADYVKSFRAHGTRDIISKVVKGLTACGRAFLNRDKAESPLRLASTTAPNGRPRKRKPTSPAGRHIVWEPDPPMRDLISAFPYG